MCEGAKHNEQKTLRFERERRDAVIQKDDLFLQSPKIQKMQRGRFSPMDDDSSFYDDASAAEEIHVCFGFDMA